MSVSDPLLDCAAASDATILSVRALRKTFGDNVALDGANLTIDRGEIVALLGPNGAGKTTFASIVAGVRTPDEGTVSVCGLDALRDAKATRGLIGYAPQRLALYLVDSVRETLHFFGRLAGLGGAQLRDATDEVAVALQLTALLSRRIRDLSGGQQRRVHTAAALLTKPPLLLLDEPTVGADVETRKALVDVVRQRALDGVAICYTTHYLSEVEHLEANVAFIVDGQTSPQQPVRELMESHGQPQLKVEFAPRSDGSQHSPALIPLARDSDAVGHALASLGPTVSEVTSVEIVRPTLESIYFALVTGERGQLPSL